MVQLDGVVARVLAQAIKGGLAPTLARWLGTGSAPPGALVGPVPVHHARSARPGCCMAAPARCPAFRWWDRSLGRMVVTNHPVDAALVEERLSDGKGLLAFDGRRDLDDVHGRRADVDARH